MWRVYVYECTAVYGCVYGGGARVYERLCIYVGMAVGLRGLLFNYMLLGSMPTTPYQGTTYLRSKCVRPMSVEPNI